MARKAGPTDEDYDKAVHFGLRGLIADQDADSIMEQLSALHPHNKTFPAEVLLELAAEAIEESGASPADPIHYCLLYTSPSPRDGLLSRMPSSA